MIKLGSALLVAALVFGSFAGTDPAFAQSKVKRQDRAGKKLDAKRSSVALPSSRALRTPEAKPRDLRAVRPLKSSALYEGSTLEIAYEKELDNEIREAYKLSQNYKRSRARGEIWLRLAEAYIEKAQRIEFREQAEFEKKMKDFADKKTKRKPVQDLREAREYNKKAIQLVEWFIRDFPQDKKMDQALFFLGLNHFDTGDVQKGEAFYKKLVKEYPNSPYVMDSFFALGEFYFENDRWQQSLDAYYKVITKKAPRLQTLAMFKAAWCLYRLNRVGTALKMLERVIRVSRSSEAGESGSGRKAVNKVRLASEALKDYVPFYSESGNYKTAAEEFRRVAGSEAEAAKMLERLAYLYVDSGNREGAQAIFRELIGNNPAAERAADYQYQIVLAFATTDQKKFREELVTWLENFGPGTAWAQTNAKNAKLVDDTAKLQETTLRNYVLQMHQAAQNSRAQFSQQQAGAGYALYNKYFNSSPNFAEMQFFHGELLFDMSKHTEAARAYSRSYELDPKGKYADKAVTNALLALEKELPSAEEIEKKRGESIEPIPLDPEVARFEKAALKYFEIVPKGDKVSDIKRRLGVLYYSYNHFDKAMAIFEEILKTDPKSQNAEIAGNLMLDIYKLRGDMGGLTERAQQLLANPAIAKSKFGEEIKAVVEKAGYLRAQKAVETGDHGTAAKEFEAFSLKTKGGIEVATAARYNAGVSFEKAGDIANSIRLHGLVVATPSKDPKTKKLQNDSRNALARLYQQTGQLELAARQYEKYADENPTDQTAINAYFNAAVILDGLSDYNGANRNYDAYLKKSKKADRHETIFFQAEIARRRGALSKAAVLYEQYLGGPARNVQNIMKAHYQMAEVSKRLGRVTKTKEYYGRTIATFQAFKKQGKEAGVQYAAEARFALSQETLGEIRAVKFTANDRQQAKAAVEIKRLREKYIAQMKEVIRFDYAPMIVAALASSGQMFDNIAAAFARIPVPAGLSAQEGAKYKELIQQEINGIRNEAKNSYRAAYDKSIELESFGEWSRIAKRGLAQHDPAFQDPGEIASPAAAVDWMEL